MFDKSKYVCVQDYENHSREFMSAPAFQFVKGEGRLQDQDQHDFTLLQLKLRGLANLKTFVDPLATRLLGLNLASPICFGSFPHQGLAHKDAELASSKAAESLNQLFALSSLSTASLEEVAAHSPNAKILFELDMRLPRAVRDDLIRRILKHPQFVGIVINAQYVSSRITENEWKNDF